MPRLRLTPHRAPRGKTGPAARPPYSPGKNTPPRTAPAQAPDADPYRVCTEPVSRVRPLLAPQRGENPCSAGVCCCCSPFQKTFTQTLSVCLSESFITLQATTTKSKSKEKSKSKTQGKPRNPPHPGQTRPVPRFPLHPFLTSPRSKSKPSTVTLTEKARVKPEARTAPGRTKNARPGYRPGWTPARRTPGAQHPHHTAKDQGQEHFNSSHPRAAPQRRSPTGEQSTA
jgi:hypothetical protein